LNRHEKGRRLRWASWIGLWAVFAVGILDSPPISGQPVEETDRGTAGGDTLVAQLVSISWLDSLPGGSPPPHRNGDTLRVETAWDRADLNVSAIGLNQISSVNDTVPLANLGEGLYLLDLVIPDPNPGVGDGRKTFSFVATTPTGVDTTVTENRLCLTNTPPQAVTSSLVPDRTIFQAVDLLSLSSFWTTATGLDLEVFLDVSAVDTSLIDPLLPATLSEETGRWEIDYTIPSAPDRRGPDNQDLPLVWVGRDSGCGVTRDTSHVIVLDHSVLTSPTLLSWDQLSPVDNGVPRALRDGDTVRLLTRWDRDSLAVSADFSEVAPGDTSRAVVVRRAPAEYEVIYTLPEFSPRPDGSGLRVGLAAEGPVGAVGIDRSVSLCLSNHVPVHLESRIITSPAIYRGGDSLRIVTRWTTESGLDLKVGARFDALEPALGDSIWPGDIEGDSVVIRFEIPSIRDERGADGSAIQIPIVAQENGGCSRAIFDQVFIALDTSPPDTIGPVLDMLPSQTFEDSIFVSGVTTPEADLVNLQRGRTDRLSTVVDSVTGRFGAMLALTPNEINLITANAEDELGNRTSSSEPMFVRQVSTLRITFPSPFPRNEEISVQDPRGMNDLTLAIYDLEGALARRWQPSGRVLEFNTVWDGDDEVGGRARQGYYLVRATWRDSEGRLREETEGLILAN